MVALKPTSARGASKYSAGLLGLMEPLVSPRWVFGVGRLVATRYKVGRPLLRTAPISSESL
jgi:hypothetical protein